MDENNDNGLDVTESGGEFKQAANSVKEGAQKTKQTAQNIKKVVEKVSKKAQQTMAKAGKNIAQIVSKLGPALPWIALAILIIIVVVGILAFFISMPGMLTGKLKDIAQGAAEWWQSLYENQADAYTNEKDILETANYIKSMGYDLIGYGFIPANTSYQTTYKSILDLEDEGYSDSDGDGIYKDSDGNVYSEDYIGGDGYIYNGATGKKNEYESAGYYMDKYGIQYSASGNETGVSGTYEASGDVVALGESADVSLLRTYLMSDKRIFFIRNYDGTGGFLDWLHDLYVNDELSGDWANGLLSLWKASNFKATEKYSKIEAGSIKVNGESKTLTIKKGWGNNDMVYEMDGWTGRYGLSLEFLLSLHLATMAPELVSTMARSFDTEVQLYLDTVTNASATGYYYNEKTEEYISLEELFDGYGLAISKKEAFNIMKDHNIESKKEGEFACQYGIEPEIVYLNGKTGDEIDNTYKNVVTGYSVDYIEDVIKDGYLNRDKDLDGQSDIKTWENLSTKMWKDGVLCDGSETKHEKTDAAGNKTEIDCDNTLVLAGEIMNEKLIYKMVDKINDALYYIKTIYPNYTWIDEDDSNTEKKASEYAYKYIVHGTGVPYDSEDTDRSTNDTDEAYRLYSKNNRNLYNASKIKVLEDILTIEELRDINKTYDDGGGLEFEICTFTSNEEKEEERTELILSLFIYRTNIDYNYDMIVMVYEEPSEKEKTEITTCYECAIAEYDSKNTTKTCSACRKYIKTLRKALKEVDDQQFDTYIPYIARVVDSWFRDTYFVVPEEADVAINDIYTNHGTIYGTDEGKQQLTGNSIEFISVDDEYLKDTGEHWTEYEMNDDGTYKLYVLGSNGQLETDMNNIPEIAKEKCEQFNGYILYKGTNEDATKEGIALTKKLANTTKSEGGWSAYGREITAAATPKLVEVNDESPKSIKRITNYSDGSYDKIIYYYLDQMPKIKQIDDGQRGITNSKIKKMFKIRKYYIYDGTAERAEAIYEDWQNVISLYSSKYSASEINFVPKGVADPYTGAMIYNPSYEEQWNSAIEKELEKAIDYYYYGTDISKIKLEEDPRNPDLIGNIDINSDSLSAFAILENTHTLDADYAYRDFKELIVELDYFDKEDLSDKTPEIFTWILPELQEQWPIRLIDKDENYYGTYIHSDEAIKNIKQNLGITQKEENGEESNSEEEESEDMQQIKNAKGYTYSDESATSDEETETEDDSADTATATGEIVSPVTGEIIAYGTYERTNTDLVKYEGVAEEDAKETVGYIQIKIADSDDLFDFVEGTTDIGYATEDDSTTYTNAQALNAYFEEYEGVCEGYIITIDGIKLLDGATDLDTLKALSDDNFKVTESFEPNITPNIVDDDLEKANQQKENAKAAAPAVVKNGDRIFIREGTVIGYTTKNEINNKNHKDKDYSYIRIILRNDERALRENVEEYFDLPIIALSGADSGIYDRFYFIPYESGALEEPGCGATSVSTCSVGEVAVGICQWTSLPGRCNNVPWICKKLYEKDPQSYAVLNTFTSYSADDIWDAYNDGSLKAAFNSLEPIKEQLTLHQFEIAQEEKLEIVKNQGVEWLGDRHGVVLGTYFSLINWAPNAGWQNAISESMTDEQIIKTLLVKACNVGSTAGTLETRWTSQAKLACDILSGSFTEVEDFVKKGAGAYPEYGNGKNLNFLNY